MCYIPYFFIIIPGTMPNKGKGVPNDFWSHVHLSMPISMEPWTATKNVFHLCGGDTISCPGPYPTAAFPEFHVGCHLVLCYRRGPMEPWAATRNTLSYSNVSVTPAPDRFPTQRPLVLSFMSVVTLSYAIAEAQCSHGLRPETLYPIVMCL